MSSKNALVISEKLEMDEHRGKYRYRNMLRGKLEGA